MLDLNLNNPYLIFALITRIDYTGTPESTATKLKTVYKNLVAARKAKKASIKVSKNNAKTLYAFIIDCYTNPRITASAKQDYKLIAQAILKAQK